MQDAARVTAHRQPPAPASAALTPPAEPARPAGPALWALLAELHEDSPDGLSVFDGDWRYLYANAAAVRLAGLDYPACVGRRIDEGQPGLWATAFGRALRAARDGEGAAELRAYTAPSGRRYDLRVSPCAAGVAVRFRDVTAAAAADEARARAADALRESEARARTLVETAPHAIALHRDGQLFYVNPATLRLLGADAPERVLGRPVREFVAPSDHARLDERAAALAGGAPLVPGVAYALRPLDGVERYVEATSVPVVIDGRPAVQTLLHDVTERVAAERRLRASEEQLRHAATHDPLTGLGNRALFRERVEHALHRVDRGDPVAVLSLDLDDFKAVNDRLGHDAGDALLCAVAERLLHATRGGDTVARLGGDEFAVLLAGAAAADVGAVADRVLAALSGTVPVAGRPVAVGTSVGVAHAHPGDTAEELLRNADLAMYRAKHGGKGRVAIFEPAMHRAVVARLDLASELAGAAARGEVQACYQPIVDLATRRVVGVEALARWAHPRLGLLLPAAFIPLAEETGAIHAVGGAVLAQACAQVAAWRRAARGRAVPHLHVNVSSRQLEHDAFAAELAGVLAGSGLPAGELTLELTEGTLMRRTEDALARLHALKALGVRLAVDDFGTGYSSLAYLQRFPVDALKLDKSFVDGIAVTPHDAEIARVVLALGGALGLRTVAEGVETPAQYARLRALGCEYGQGQLFAPAVEAGVVEELLWGEDPFPV